MMHDANRQRGSLKRNSLICFLLGLIALIGYEWSGLVEKAEAIPAFSRKYNFSCNVCHVPGFPKLNDFGNIFRDRGFQLGTEADLPEYKGIAMGFWPVSLRTTVAQQLASLHTGANGNISTSAVGFTALDLLSMGTLTRDVAFRIQFSGQESSQFGFNPKTSDLEHAAVKLMRLEKYVGIKSAPGDYLVNLQIGKHELDVPFSQDRSPTLNTPIVGYFYVPGVPYLSGTLNTNGASFINGGYLNPNTFGIGDSQPGIELTGIKKTAWSNGYFRYALDGIFSNPSTGSGFFGAGSCPNNSDGIPVCGTGGGKSVSFYGHLTQSFGGYGILKGHRIGVLAMFQQTPTVPNAACPTCGGTGGTSASRTAAGVDASLTYNTEWNLFGAWMYNHFNKTLFASQAPFQAAVGGPPGGILGAGRPQSADYATGFVELDYYPALLPLPFFKDPGWFFAYRFDFVQNYQQGFSNFAGNYNNVLSHTATIRKFLHQSARTSIALHIEYNWYKDNGVAASRSDLIGQTVFTGLDFSF